MALRGIYVSVFTFGPGSSQRNLMKKRSVRASKQANATGSLRKRKARACKHIPSIPATSALERRYGLLGDITASVPWVRLLIQLMVCMFPQAVSHPRTGEH